MSVLAALQRQHMDNCLLMSKKRLALWESSRVAGERVIVVICICYCKKKNTVTKDI